MPGENEFDMSAVSEQIGNDLFGAPEVETPDLNLEVETPEIETPEVENPEVENPETPEVEKILSDEQVVSGAPKTWRKEAAAEWDKLPPTVQAEIAKREEDMYRGLETYKLDASIGNNFKACITPHLEHLQKAGVDPYAEINGLLEYGKTMRFGTVEEKMSLIGAICSEYGIDLLDLAEHTPASSYVDPAVKALQAEVNQLKSARQQEESQFQTQARNEAQAKVDAFKADPKNEHFDLLEPEMIALMKAGIATTLEDAYSKALKLNPITAAKEQARQTAEANRKSQEKVAAAQKAKAAQLETNARPGSATTPLGSMDDTLLATLNEIKSR